MNGRGELHALRVRIQILESENEILKAENKLLRSKLGPAVWRVDGGKAERFVKQLIGGEIQLASAPFDLILPNGIKFEIKFSNLNTARAAARTRRWNWPHILGSNRAKQFDRLLLLAPPDPQYRDHYCDPKSPLIIFDVPFENIPVLLESSGTIWTNTNPFKIRRRTHQMLLNNYQISREALIDRYPMRTFVGDVGNEEK